MRKIATAIGNGIQSNPIIIASLGLFVLMIFFVPRFATQENLFSLFGQMSYLGIVTVGLAFVLVGGGNDLSIGSTISITGVIASWAMVRGLNIGLSVLLALAVGAGIGFLNGVFIAGLGTNAFMMTLITQMLFEGIALAVTSATSVTGLPAAFIEMGNKTILFLPAPVFVMLITYIAGHIVLTKSLYGRKLFVTGANKDAARLVGVNCVGILLSTYVLSGVLGGVSGVILAGRLGVGSPSAGRNIIMEVIGAAVIGGNSLFGGKGSVVGAAFGALLLSLISNGLTLLGVEWALTMIVKGFIILLAVCVDVAGTRLMSKRMLNA